MAEFAAASQFAWFLPALWVFAFLILLLMSVIDIRTGIIPDELNVALGIIAMALGFFLAASANGTGLFMGPISNIFSVPGNIWVGRVAGAVFGFVFFEFLLLVTQGRGIGMGDVKLALPLGLLFGWPDILSVVGFAFVCGAFVGTLLILLKKRTMKGTLPFGPFLAIGAASVFFLGAPIAQWYLHIMGL
jgi:prepilin signal peptidase PulO-like enzyme (type II secretory pathway)